MLNTNNSTSYHPDHNLTGLTMDEVAASRAKHGLNVLTPVEHESMWDKLRSVCSHWIMWSMYALILLSAVAAMMLVGSVGTDVWMMPIVLSVATVFILLVGWFGGFDDPLFRILMTAFVLSLGISIYEYVWEDGALSLFAEPIGIIFALLLATVVAYLLQRSNEKTFQSLNEVNDNVPVKVMREGNVMMIPRCEIVVGDIVLLEAGEEVPADCQLISSYSLMVNESSLTGEMQSMKTHLNDKADKDATYPSYMILRGTTITEGTCTARVVRTGDETECGKVFRAAQVDEGTPTPLGDKLDRLSKMITNISYIFAGLILCGRVIIYFVEGKADFSTTDGCIDFIGYLLSTVMIAVTLIVVAVPEGLPMSVTLSLAFSMRLLMRDNTLPRTIHSCETMGATSVICTDKTGTLTQNVMRVSLTSLASVEMPLIYEMIAANSTAHLNLSNPTDIKPVGNPTEGALLMWMHEQGGDYQSLRESALLIHRLPFSTENKYMASVVHSTVTGRKMLYIKGAPEIILSMSDLSSEMIETYSDKLRNYQNMAMRTIAIAYREIDDNDTEVIMHNRLMNDGGLTFAGIFAINDPIRPAVPYAILDCMKAGIDVKIVTGDTSATTIEISRQVGLWTKVDDDSNVMTGAEFAAMSDDELKDRILSLKILARARPQDKQRLVRLLKECNLVVAVTGDGTNDAPALNAADVGLSMGDGTAVAKEASDMTILDNSFSTIAKAVMWGRSLYKNIQRFIMFQMTINVVACLIVLIGAFTGTDSPLTVTQMLWVNLIMDTFAAIALASLPPSRSVIFEKPRHVSDHIISRKMALRIFGLGGLFTGILVYILFVMQYSDVRTMSDIITNRFGSYDGLSEYELSLFFTTFIMLQFWNMFNAKAFMTGRSALHNIARCKGFVAIAAAILIGQILIVELGNEMFSVCPLNAIDWIVIISLTSLVLIIGELLRKLRLA